MCSRYRVKVLKRQRRTTVSAGSMARSHGLVVRARKAGGDKVSLGGLRPGSPQASSGGCAVRAFELELMAARVGYGSYSDSGSDCRCSPYSE
jgi:hypothetical protein